MEHYIYSLPPNELHLTATLREWILNYDARITEKLRWGIPFFKFTNWMCFLLPIKNERGIDLCFYDGILFEKCSHLLKKHQRKNVFCHSLPSPESLHYAAIKQLLKEAMHIRRNISTLQNERFPF